MIEELKELERIKGELIRDYNGLCLVKNYTEAKKVHSKIVEVENKITGIRLAEAVVNRYMWEN